MSLQHILKLCLLARPVYWRSMLSRRSWRRRRSLLLRTSRFFLCPLILSCRTRHSRRSFLAAAGLSYAILLFLSLAPGSCLQCCSSEFPYLDASACLSSSSFFAIAFDPWSVLYALIISSASACVMPFFELKDALNAKKLEL